MTDEERRAYIEQVRRENAERQAELSAKITKSEVLSWIAEVIDLIDRAFEAFAKASETFERFNEQQRRLIAEARALAAKQSGEPLDLPSPLSPRRMN